MADIEKPTIDASIYDSAGTKAVSVVTNGDFNELVNRDKNLETVLGTVSLVDEGHLNVSVISNEDEYGFEAENTPMGEQRVVEPVRLAGANFEGPTIEANFWTAVATGVGASVVQANAKITLTSGTVNGNKASIISVRRARYIGGYGMRYRAVLNVPVGVADNTRRWGIGFGTSLPTLTDGAWFNWTGTTFGITTMENGTPATVTSGSFNGDLGASYTPATTVLTFEIYWTNSSVWFVVGGRIIHKVTASTDTWASTMAHHIIQDNTNTATSVGSTLSIRTATIYRLGKVDTSPFYKHIVTATNLILKRSAGRLHRVIFNAFGNGAIVTIGDSTTAATDNAIAIINPPNGVFPSDIEYLLDYYVGLTVTITGTVDLTIVYE